MRRPLLTLGVATLLIGVAMPARAELSPADVDDARDALRAVAVALETQVEAYETAVAEEAVLLDRLDSLTVSLTARERELVLARRSARDRAAQMYMAAGSDPGVVALVSAEEMAQAPARYVYLQSVSETDRDVINRLEAARRDFEQQRQLVDEAIAAQTGVREEMDALLDVIYTELEAANEEYQAVKAAWDKQEEERIARELFFATSTTTTTTTTTVPPAPTTTLAVGTTSTTIPGGSGSTTTTTQPGSTTTTTVPTLPPSGTMVCPVDGATTFRDSWGEPRSGSRGHKGVDMMAARWTPLVAIETGYIYRISFHSLGGLGIYVHGESGSLWYYAHNEAIAEGIEEGDNVVAGQRIAYVGTSGNANVPHVHFAWIPNADWVYQNPFPIVDSLCR